MGDKEETEEGGIHGVHQRELGSREGRKGGREKAPKREKNKKELRKGAYTSEKWGAGKGKGRAREDANMENQKRMRKDSL